MLLFAQAKYLYLLLLIPLIIIVFAVGRSLRKRSLRRFAPDCPERIASEASSAQAWWKMILFCLAFSFFIIGLARPVIGAKLSERQTRGAEIVICLDVSNSMLARDYSPDRLSRAKLALSSLVDRLQDDRIGLVVFAGTSFVQLPVTTDYVSAKMFLNSIDTRPVSIQGTAIGDAILTAARSFSAQSEKSRAIIVITDGENHEDDAIEAAKTVASTGIKIYTIGVGSQRGEPLSVDGELLRDKDGQIVVSRLDEALLKDIAREGDGLYVHAENSEFGLNPIIDDLRRMEDETFNSIVFEEYDEQYMYFFALALVFFVLEMLLSGRRSKKKLF